MSDADLPLDQLLEASANAYVLFAADEKIAWANKAFLNATMRSRDEVIGRKWFEAFPTPAEVDGHRLTSEALERVRRTGQRDAIALMTYPIANPDGTVALRKWSCVVSPVSDAQGKVTHVLGNPVDVTELQELRDLRDEANLIDRARRVEQRGMDAAEQIAQSRRMVEQAPGIVSVMMGPEHRIELANADCRALWGRGPLVGHTVAEILPDASRLGLINMLDRVFNTGEPYAGQRVPMRRYSAEGAGSERRFVDFVFQPIHDRDGTIIGIYGQGHDVTEQVLADEHKAWLLNELNHRVKNTLSIIQGLAHQSFAKVGNGAAYRAFKRRLDALAASHSLLTGTRWDPAELRHVILTAVEAAAGNDASRFLIRGGEDGELGAQSTVLVGMIIHELATNAIKYGALSVPAGRVEIDLRVSAGENGRLLTLHWCETGGPPVSQPAEIGFGTRLLLRGNPNHPAAQARLDYAPEGLTYTLVCGLAG